MPLPKSADWNGTQFEYQIVHFENDRAMRIEMDGRPNDEDLSAYEQPITLMRVLHVQGVSGWEMCGILPGRKVGDYQIIFKRPAAST
jgi:hypothetical protein